MHKFLVILGMSCLVTITAAPASAQSHFVQPGVTSGSSTPDYPPMEDPSPDDPPIYDLPPIVCVTYPCELDPTPPESTYPADPDPADPEPADPEPTDPELADLEPADPEPADPEPIDPEAADAEPTPLPESVVASEDGEEDSGKSGAGGATGGSSDGSKSNGSLPNMLFSEGFPDNEGEDSPAEAASDPGAQQLTGKVPTTVDKMLATEEVASNASPFNSRAGGIGVLLALVGLSAAGLVVSHQIRSKQITRNKPTIQGELRIEGDSTPNEVIERAASASADAVESFSSARTATKAASATSGGGNNVPGEPAPEAQSIDTSSDPVLAAWVPGKHIRLLIADDEPAVRSKLRAMLESQSDFRVVGEAATGVQAVELADQLHPRVVLMDLHIPGMEGVAASDQIKARHSDTYTLVTTDKADDADIGPAIEAGATGYLLKDAPSEEVFETVRATAQGKPTNTNR